MARHPDDEYRLPHAVNEPALRQFRRPETTDGAPDINVRNRSNSDLSGDARRHQSTPPINVSVTHSLNESHVEGVTPSLIATITEQVLKNIEARKPPNIYPQAPPGNAPLSPTASVQSPMELPRDVHTPPSPQKTSDSSIDSPIQRPIRLPPVRPKSPSSILPRTTVAEDSAAERSSDSEETTLEKIWGKLFEDGKPTEKMGQLLRGMAHYMVCLL